MSKYGNCQVLDITPVITLPAYTANDVVGGKLTLGAFASPSARGVLKSLVVIDKANQKGALTILLFDDDPSASTFTDNAALDIDPADLLKVVAKVNVLAADYETLDSQAVANIDLSLVIRSVQSARNLYAVIVTTGSPDFASVSDLKLRFGILND